MPLYRPFQSPLIFQSAIAGSLTGTLTTTTIKTITIPGGAMGPNGVCRVTTLWSYTNNGNNKTLILTFGGTTYLGSTVTATAMSRQLSQIANRNSESSQVGHSVTGFIGSSSSSPATSSVNTAADFNILLRGTLADVGDTITVEAYQVEIFYGA